MTILLDMLFVRFHVTILRECFVFGMRDGTIYFYKKKGVQATIPISTFKIRKMKSLIIIFLLLNCALYSYGQINPLEKSVNIYLTRLLKQGQKVDTLFVQYESKELEQFHKNIIANIFIQNVSGLETDNKTLLSINLNKKGKFREVTITPQSIRYNKNINEYEVFISTTLFVKFKYTSKCWKYINYHINAL